MAVLHRLRRLRQAVTFDPAMWRMWWALHDDVHEAAGYATRGETIPLAVLARAQTAAGAGQAATEYRLRVPQALKEYVAAQVAFIADIEAGRDPHASIAALGAARASALLHPLPEFGPSLARMCCALHADVHEAANYAARDAEIPPAVVARAQRAVAAGKSVRCCRAVPPGLEEYLATQAAFVADLETGRDPRASIAAMEAARATAPPCNPADVASDRRRNGLPALPRPPASWS